MDIDDSPAATQQNDDSELLRMFSCMGTEEKDNLVTQFQFIGNEPSQVTAKFFLDMNNWNLQTAIGCYFDYLASARGPQMKILKSWEVECITPNTPFTVSWLVQNNGETEWPAGTCLKEVSVQALDHMSIEVPALAPMDSTKITIELVSPAELGDFCTKWRLCSPGLYSHNFFGATITCVVNVCDSDTLAITQQLNDLHVPNIPTSVIEHAANPSTENFLSPQNETPPYFASQNVIQPSPNPNPNSNDEEMWDDAL